MFGQLFSSNKQTKIKQTFATMMVHLAVVDDDLSTGETEYIKRWLDKLSHSEKKACADAFNNHDLETALKYAKQNFEWSDCQELFNELLMTATVDGSISKKEAGFILFLAAYLGADIEQFKKEVMVERYGCEQSIIDEIEKEVEESANKAETVKNSSNDERVEVKGFKGESENSSSNSLFCTECGKENLDTSKFCSGCGKPLN